MLGVGIDLKYGARHLKRAIERFLVYPLSNLVATQQVETGDLVTVGFDKSKNALTFMKEAGKMIVNDEEPEHEDDPPMVKSDAAGAPLPQAEAAPQLSKTKSENDV